LRDYIEKIGVPVAVTIKPFLTAWLRHWNVTSVEKTDPGCSMLG